MLHLDAQAVAARLHRPTLIDALDAAFRLGCRVPHREHHELGPPGGAMLLVMPAWRAGGCMGVKLVTVFPDNAARGLPAVHATYTVFDGTSGEPLAVLDGTELTLRRTAAASALAARYLADSRASRLLMVGTGALAPHLIESHAAVRPIDSVRVWGRNPGHAGRLAARFAAHALDVQVATDLAAAVGWADIVSCATLATEPLVCGGWLHAGQHLDLVGAFTPAMREADDAALARSRIYVDTRDALSESGELVQALAAGVITADSICGDLAALAGGRAAGRASGAEITLFKSVGTALEDLAAAELALGGSVP